MNSIMITWKIGMVATQNYYSQTLIDMNIFMKILATRKICLTLEIMQQLHYDNSKELVVGKIKDETAGVAIK